MKLKQYFDIIDINEINRCIAEKQEEHLTLEFKTVNHPDYNNENKGFDKKNISKIISGFANSTGGIVIWGIEAKTNTEGQDVAKAKRPIKELTKFLNLLNRLEGQAVTPTVTGIEHKKIVISDDTGFIKSFIPQSDSAPHMANFSEKHYYKRSGDSFYQCEHYDIIDMISRKRSPRLKVSVRVIQKEMRHQSIYRWQVVVSVINEGTNIAKYPYLALNFSLGFVKDGFGIDGNKGTGLAYVRNNLNYQHNYSGGIDRPIFPSAMVDVDKFYIECPIDSNPPHLILDYIVTAEDCESSKGKLEINADEFQKHS